MKKLMYYQLIALTVGAMFLASCVREAPVEPSPEKVAVQLSADEDNLFLGIIIRYDEGHAWLMDGYLKQQQEITTTLRWYPVSTDPTTIMPPPYETTSTSYIYREFFHNNWGWEGADNGWYACGVFDPVNNADIPTNSYNDGAEVEFDEKLEIWPNIRKP